jgi:predicted lipoprotein with Yx(FWY)xxD motif
MRWRKTMSVGAVAVGLGLALAGCGSGSNGTGSNGSGSTSGAAGGSTVSTRNVAGVGTVLTGADGKTLYFADQETSGQIKCINACMSFWMPVTVSGGTTPTAGTGVTGRLATLDRPDGSVQITYDGKPLYTFAQDSGPGDANGNGFKDTFNGTDLLWHAAAPTGAAAGGAAPTNTGAPGNGYGY